MNTVWNSYTIKATGLTVAVLLASIVFMACTNGRESSSSDEVDSLSQPAGDSGVPLNNLERSRDTDSVEQPVEPKSGAALNNLDRSRDEDTTGAVID